MNTQKIASRSVTVTIPLQISISLGSLPANLVSAPPRPESGPALLDEAVAQFSLQSLNATTFTWRTALSLALASSLSYSAKSDVETTGRAWGLSTCQFLEAVDTQCFVASTPTVALIAFRGTESVGDWLADLNTARVARDYGVVHRGFYHAFADVRPQIEALLGGLGGQRIVVTGHSLGGALATVAAAEWFHANTFKVAAVYTYGQPRVGNDRFCKFVNQKLGASFSRFVNDDDIVPRVPPGFRHTGKLFHLDASGNLQNFSEGLATEAALSESEPASTEPAPLTEAQFDQLRAELLIERQGQSLESVTEAPVAAPELEGLFPSFRDHSLDRYIGKIQRHV